MSYSRRLRAKVIALHKLRVYPQNFDSGSPYAGAAYVSPWPGPVRAAHSTYGLSEALVIKVTANSKITHVSTIGVLYHQLEQNLTVGYICWYDLGVVMTVGTLALGA